MKPSAKLPILFSLAALALAGCKDDGEERGETRSDPQDRFGRVFAAAFNASEADEPIDPEPGDAGELSLTDDPIDF